MSMGYTAFSRSWARMALRREGANDAQASPVPPLLTLARPESMQPVFIPWKGS